MPAARERGNERDAFPRGLYVFRRKKTRVGMLPNLTSTRIRRTFPRVNFIQTMNPLTNKNLLIFLGGVAVGVFGAKLVKSEKFRQLCLLGTAKGIQLKEELGTLFAEVQEHAADFLAEAGSLAGTPTESPAKAEAPAVPEAPTPRRRRAPRSRAAAVAPTAVRKPRKPRAKKNAE